MPELPEVELVRRELRPLMEGAAFESVVTNRPNLRTAFPVDFVARLEGCTVTSLDRRGKYLLAVLSSGDVLVMHLGMSGSFRVTHQAEQDERHDHVRFRMSSGATIVFNDPRRFGFMDVLPRNQLAGAKGPAALGPEPLSPDFDGAALARACRGKKTSLKVALCDQRVVAGLGNIYVSEALHLARLSPKRRAATIATRSGAPRDSAIRLAAAIKRVLEKAIRGDDRFRVYDREGKRCPTPGCRGVIRRIVQAGRSTFVCGVCQK
jgi:formamidopyrimidine-DNA glycosylase